MIEEFKKITGYDLSAFFSRFVSFVDNNYNSIVSYYSGNGSIGKTVFNTLDQLISDSDHVNDLFSNNIVNLSYNVNWWEILEQFEDARDSGECKERGDTCDSGPNPTIQSINI